MLAMSEMRRAADRRPGLTNVGDEQKAALIEKRKMPAPTRGVFLSAAIRLASTEQCLHYFLNTQYRLGLSARGRDGSFGALTVRGADRSGR